MRFRIGVDIGGTFTDCVVVDEAGGRSTAKALTTPGVLEEGVLAALAHNAEQLDLTRRELLAAADLFVHGTTQATNALLTRTGAPTGLITTKGHEDAIVIGRVYAKMAGLVERDLVHSSRLSKPEPIVPRELIKGITERIDRDGDVVVPLREDEVIAAVDALVAEGIEALAVSFLWSFVNDAHERRVKELVAERAPEVFVSFSHEVAPVLGEYERTATTALNAYVGPKVVAYLERLEAHLGEEGLRQPLLIMQASGGLTSVPDAAGKPIVTLDSGPTGGVLGCQFLGRHYGEDSVICTDVGGTSFDVGLVLHGEVPLDPEPVLGQYTLHLPKVLVSSIGSGGGSIAWRDEGGLLRVGPLSAGSRPGPACYGLGGSEPTVTDADLVLGYLDADAFLGGRMKLSRELAWQALARFGQLFGLQPEEVAIGIFRIINAQMADLIRKSTIEQGHDPRECVLVAYGGAGPTHAVFYGQDIGAKAIIVPADSTVFSAEGMLTCDITHTAELSRRHASPLTAATMTQLEETFALLERRVREEFAREGSDPAEVRLARWVGVRFQQQVQTLMVPVEPGTLGTSSAEQLLDGFLHRYGQVYGEGSLLVGGGVELELHRVVGTLQIPSLPMGDGESISSSSDATHAQVGERQAYFDPDGFTTTKVYDGAVLRPSDWIVGPAIVQRMGDSVVIPPGFAGAVDGYLSLRLGPLETSLAAGPQMATKTSS